MANWSQLPVEILSGIFHHLNSGRSYSKDLEACALTCHSWRLSARPILFSRIEIAFREQFAKLMQYIITHDQPLGGLVKYLDITEVFDEIGEEIAEFLGALFPNLEELVFKENPVSYEVICNSICEGGRLSGLKVVPENNNNWRFESYWNCLKKKKDVISHIKLVDQVIFGDLDNFSNLKSMAIEFEHEESRSFMDYLELVNKHSTLSLVKKLSLKLDKHCEEAGKLNLSKDLNDVQPLHNVTMLEISGYGSRIITNDTVMLYIMKKFPNLIDLRISRVRDKVESIIYYDSESSTASIVVSAETILQFFNYVSNINSFYVEHIFIKENTTPVIKRFSSSTSNADSVKFSTLRLQFDVYDESGELQPIVTLDNLKERAIGVNFDKSMIRLERQNLQLLEQAGQYFNNIVLDCELYTLENSILLSDIAKYCEHATSLTILRCYDKTYKNTKIFLSSTIQNHTLTELKLEKYEYQDLYTEFFSCCSRLFPSLKTLSFERMERDRYSSRECGVIQVPTVWSLKSLKLIFSYSKADPSEECSINAVCINICTDEKSTYLFFDFKEEVSIEKGEWYIASNLVFTRYLTPSEFLSMEAEPEPEYDLYKISCKFLESFTLATLNENKSPVEITFNL